MRHALRLLLDRFLFQPANPLAVAWFRILFALLLAFAFWPRGLVPAASVSEWPWIEQLFPTVFLTIPYRLAIYVGIVLVGLGWRPRVVGLVLLCLLLPHIFLNRGQQSRQVMLLMLLFISLPPATPVWHWRQWTASGFAAGPMWPIRLLQILLTLLYGLNAYVKSGPDFLNGQVLMALSTLPNFLVDLTSGYLQLGPVSIPVAVLAIGTVVVESWLAIGFWIPRCRWPTAVLGVAFHLSLKFVVRIFMLDYATMLLYLAFLLPFQRSETLESETESTEASDREGDVAGGRGAAVRDGEREGASRDEAGSRGREAAEWRATRREPLVEVGPTKATAKSAGTMLRVPVPFGSVVAVSPFSLTVRHCWFLPSPTVSVAATRQVPRKSPAPHRCCRRQTPRSPYQHHGPGNWDDCYT